MNNEPVAWMQHHYETGKVTKFSPVKVWEDDIPLYLHPAKEQELLAEIEGLKKDLKYFTSPCDPLCKPNICDCYKARFAISNRKTLTDDEIFKEMEFLPSSIAIEDEDLIKFARAILRKAQEK